MSRTAGSNGARTAAAIHRAGLRLIHRHGYEAMSLRELAAEVGLRPASLYNHIRTKQDLLFTLVQDHMQALLRETDAALGGAGGGAAERLRAFVSHHVLYHLEKKEEVFVANFELRALDAANHARIVALRRRYEEVLIGILEDGAAAGEWAIRDARIAAYGILAMLTGACTWYKPEGRLTRSEVVELHLDMVLHGCAGPVGKAGKRGRAIGGP